VLVQDMTARDEMLNDVAARLAKLTSATAVRVGIDGVDAAGKTTLADNSTFRPSPEFAGRLPGNESSACGDFAL
jgi:hypothetical protein